MTALLWAAVALVGISAGLAGWVRIHYRRKAQAEADRLLTRYLTGSDDEAA